MFRGRENIFLNFRIFFRSCALQHCKCLTFSSSIFVIVLFQNFRVLRFACYNAIFSNFHAFFSIYNTIFHFFFSFFASFRWNCAQRFSNQEKMWQLTRFWCGTEFLFISYSKLHDVCTHPYQLVDLQLVNL